MNLCKQYCTYFSIHFDHGFAMAGIYFISTVSAKTDPEKIDNILIKNILMTRFIVYIETIFNDCTTLNGYSY